MTDRISNFGRNVEFRPKAIYRPGTAKEVLEILDRHRCQEIRAIGKLHSWSRAAATTGVLLDLQNLNSVEISREGQSAWATVGAGCQIKRLIKQLAAHDLTLPSLGLIDEQTVAGATATGTHGSGKNSLSHFVEALSIAHYDDETGEAKITVVDSGPGLKAARCSLGLMGIIVSLRFRCRSRYNIEEHAGSHATLDSVLAAEEDFPQQQFYLIPWGWRYFAHHRVETAAPRSLLAPLYRAYCLGVIDIGLHLVIFALAKLLRLGWPIRFFFKRIVPLTIIRNWTVVDDSCAMLTMEHQLFRHVELEVFVQRADLEPSLQCLIDVINVFGGQEFQNRETTEAMLKKIGVWDELERHRGDYVHHYPICIRRVLPDDTMISMTSPGGRKDEDWFAISLISYQWPGDRTGFYAFANFVGPTFARLFGGRCHWGKYLPLSRELIDKSYSEIGEFRKVIQRFDSTGVFKNEWFRELF